MSLEGTKLAPFEAQCNVQKERKGPAGPEKSGINMERNWTDATNTGDT